MTKNEAREAAQRAANNQRAAHGVCFSRGEWRVILRGLFDVSRDDVEWFWPK